MAINPMELMKLRERMQLFEQQHPRIPAFMREVGERALEEGTVAEIRVTTPDGRQYVTNLRLTREDMETIALVKNARS